MGNGGDIFFEIIYLTLQTKVRNGVYGLLGSRRLWVEERVLDDLVDHASPEVRHVLNNINVNNKNKNNSTSTSTRLQQQQH